MVHAKGFFWHREASSYARKRVHAQKFAHISAPERRRGKSLCTNIGTITDNMRTNFQTKWLVRTTNLRSIDTQCASGNPVPAVPATFKEIRFRPGPAKSLNIDWIQPDFILILRQRQHTFSAIFFLISILLY